MANPDDLDGRCGSCRAFTPMGKGPDGAPVGGCMLERLPYPLNPRATCPSYRKKGSPPPKERRRGGGGGNRYQNRPAPPPVVIPKEIDLDMDSETFRTVLRQVLQEEMGVSNSPIAPRWEGGEVVIIPGREGLQEKRIPVESFFKKIIAVRDKLRVLEQRINSHKGLSPDEKIAMQQYITGCYGSLTTFNVLFADGKGDGFKGSSK